MVRPRSTFLTKNPQISRSIIMEPEGPESDVAARFVREQLRLMGEGASEEEAYGRTSEWFIHNGRKMLPLLRLPEAELSDLVRMPACCVAVMGYARGRRAANGPRAGGPRGSSARGRDARGHDGDAGGDGAREAVRRYEELHEEAHGCIGAGDEVCVRAHGDVVGVTDVRCSDWAAAPLRRVLDERSMRHVERVEPVEVPSSALAPTLAKAKVARAKATEARAAAAADAGSGGGAPVPTPAGWEQYARFFDGTAHSDRRAVASSKDAQSALSAAGDEEGRGGEAEGVTKRKSVARAKPAAQAKKEIKVAQALKARKQSKPTGKRPGARSKNSLPASFRFS